MTRRLYFGDRRGRSWPVPDGLAAAELELEGNDGARLAARFFPLKDRPVAGVVVLAHPDRRYGQHWFVREGIVPWLLGHGYEALTFDFAPYGRSRGGSTFLHEDVLAAAEAARREAGGLPVHVWGQSLGAFAAANAAPRLRFVDALVLESPYPSFASWYGEDRAPSTLALFDRVFARSVASIEAARNVAGAACRRVLVAASAADDVTHVDLSRAVYDAAPADRRAWIELPEAPHLGLFADEAYRSALLRAFDHSGHADTDDGPWPSAIGRTSATPSAPPWRTATPGSEAPAATRSASTPTP